MSAWLLPEQIADVLPVQASQIERLRRLALERAAAFGYELVVPPLLEYTEALLSEAAPALKLRTFKLVDQASGRTLGIRADTTPQVARIDAHLLNRAGPARLCYCGSVLHARVQSALASRELLQFGAEVYGEAGPQAELEVLELALDVLDAAGVRGVLVDLGDVRVAGSVLEGIPEAVRTTLHAALTDKDVGELDDLTRGLAPGRRELLLALVGLHGDATVLERARARFEAPAARGALDHLTWLGQRLGDSHPHARLGFDLADLGDYGYYTGTRFAIYAQGVPGPLVRGGRYDEVGAVFGRRRPAAGFSLDLRTLAEHVPAHAATGAVAAPWGDDPDLRQAVRALRARGETVVCLGEEQACECDAFRIDRRLERGVAGWQVVPVTPNAE